jgi:hypothetical protein
MFRAAQQLCRTAELPAEKARWQRVERHLRRSGELDRAGHAPWLGHPAQTAATVAGFLR